MVSSEDPQPIWRAAPLCTYETLEQDIHGPESPDIPSTPLAVKEVLQLLSGGLRGATDLSAPNRIGCTFTSGDELGAASNGRLMHAAIACSSGTYAKVTS